MPTLQCEDKGGALPTAPLPIITRWIFLTNLLAFRIPFINEQFRYERNACELHPGHDGPRPRCVSAEDARRVLTPH